MFGWGDISPPVFENKSSRLMSVKFNMWLLIIFLVLAIASIYLSLSNKIFLLFALSMLISSFYLFLALISDRRKQWENKFYYFLINKVENET